MVFGAVRRLAKALGGKKNPSGGIEDNVEVVVAVVWRRGLGMAEADFGGERARRRRRREGRRGERKRLM